MTEMENAFYNCPVERALQAIMGKWKPAILWELASGAKRFSELQAALPGIAHKVLSQQLTRLQRDGMVMRNHTGMDFPPGYTLTLLGGTLRPSLGSGWRFTKPALCSVLTVWFIAGALTCSRSLRAVRVCGPFFATNPSTRTAVFPSSLSCISA